MENLNDICPLCKNVLIKPLNESYTNENIKHICNTCGNFSTNESAKSRISLLNAKEMAALRGFLANTTRCVSNLSEHDNPILPDPKLDFQIHSGNSA